MSDNRDKKLIFALPRKTTGVASNSIVHRLPDPITNRYRFKLGKGKISKIGESPFKNSFDEMSFKPRTII